MRYTIHLHSNQSCSLLMCSLVDHMTEPKGTHQAREQPDLAVLSIDESVRQLQVRRRGILIQ